MKITKSLFFILFLAFLSVKVSAQKTALNPHEIPNEISTYIENYFGDHTITKAYRDLDDAKTEYEVKLNKRVKLEFDGLYKIREIDAKNGISHEVLPAQIAEYVKANYPQASVTEWKRDKDGQEIELNNRTEIQFDANGRFIKID